MLSKIIKALSVIVIIIVIITIPLTIFLVRLNNKSYVGQILKDNLIKYPKLVEMLNLNEPGDNRFYYFGSGKPVISVKIISVNSNSPDKNINPWLYEIVKTSVDKRVVVEPVEELVYGKKELLDDNDLNEIKKLVLSDGNTADLCLIYTSSYLNKPTSVGLVLHRDTIFIFRDAIDKLSEKGYIKDVLEKTTIMHEWGHLLGLDHINKDGCIMDETAEVYDHPSVGKSLPTKYCWEELEELRKLKAKII